MRQNHYKHRSLSESRRVIHMEQTLLPQCSLKTAPEPQQAELFTRCRQHLPIEDPDAEYHQQIIYRP